MNLYPSRMSNQQVAATSPKDDTSAMLDDFLSPSNNSQVRFAFPPSPHDPPPLASASSSESGSVNGCNNMPLVPFYAPTHEEQVSSRTKGASTTPRSTASTSPRNSEVSSMSSFSTLPSPASSTSSAGSKTPPPHKLIRVPSSDNPFGADAIHPKKKSMKKRRKQKIAAGAVGGMVFGGLTMGPAGIFVGAAVGSYATNKVCKFRERRAQRKYEQNNFQQAAERSNVHQATFV